MGIEVCFNVELSSCLFIAKAFDVEKSWLAAGGGTAGLRVVGNFTIDSFSSFFPLHSKKFALF